jgi:hypothetical protein
MWEQSFTECGVVKVEGINIKVYKDRFNYILIKVGKPIRMALWNGNILNVYLEDGKIRRYKDRLNYLIVG